MALVLASGCATGYNQSNFLGGFTDTQLSPEVFRVTFTGNGYTKPERAADFALLRASELCLSNGFPYFALLDAQSGGKTATYMTPGTATTTGSGNFQGTRSGNQVRGSYNYGSTTTYDPGQTITWFKPETGLIVRGFKDKPDDMFTFDAAFLEQSIKTRYKIKAKQ